MKKKNINEYRKLIAQAIEKGDKEMVDNLMADVKSYYGGKTEKMLAYDFGFIK